ncbi:Dcun1d2, partial [Symbiodinium sp. CCMP2456]
AVIMLSRQSGYKVLLEILRKTGRKHGFKVATLQELSDFNDARRNLRGERFRVLVAETSQAGEGIQFKHVRRLHLVEVPARHSDLVQRASRCVRMGGHE